MADFIFEFVGHSTASRFVELINSSLLGILHPALNHGLKFDGLHPANTKRFLAPLGLVTLLLNY